MPAVSVLMSVHDGAPFVHSAECRDWVEQGLRELQLNGALSRAALGHSFSMAKHGYFGHSGWNGSPFWQR